LGLDCRVTSIRRQRTSSANVTCAQQRGLTCEPLQRGKDLGWGAQDEPTVIVSRLAVVLCNMCVLIAIAIEVAVAVAV
jgi:hypothetical protein